MTEIRKPDESRAVAGALPAASSSGDENIVSRVRLFVWGKFFGQRMAARARQIGQFLHVGS
jgi:hypothetical protein